MSYAFHSTKWLEWRCHVRKKQKKTSALENGRAVLQSIIYTGGSQCLAFCDMCCDLANTKCDLINANWYWQRNAIMGECVYEGRVHLHLKLLMTLLPRGGKQLLDSRIVTFNLKELSVNRGGCMIRQRKLWTLAELEGTKAVTKTSRQRREEC